MHLGLQAFLAGVTVGANHSSRPRGSWFAMLALAVLGVCGVAVTALTADALMISYMPPPT